MAVGLLYLPVLHFVDSNGVPLAGGKLYSYLAGTTTPAALYTDASGSTPHSNPAVLDSSGRLIAWGTIGQAYKLDLTDAEDAAVDNTHWPLDNVVVTPLGAPLLIDDYAANSTQFLTKTDPGEVGTLNLPTTLAGELAAVRFILAEMKGVTDWVTSYATRVQLLPVISTATEVALWTPTGSTAYNFRFRVPEGWQDGSTINFKLLRRSTASGGFAIMTWQWTRIRDNTAAASPGPANVNFTVADTNSHLLTLAIASGGGVTIAAGDCIVVNITRTGDDGSDNNTGTVIPDAWWIEYTGIASR